MSKYLLLSIFYDGDSGKAALKLYDVEKENILILKDSTDHKPYLITDLKPQEIIEKYPEVIKHRGFDHLEVVEKYDLLNDRKVLMTKVVARDPLSVGGSRGALRDILKGHSWEAKVRYHNCYTYDRGLIPGTIYRIEGGRLTPIETELPKNVLEKLSSIYSGNILREVIEWAKLFQAPIPKIRRIAVDIEVYSPEPERVPNPAEATYPIIAVSLYSSDGLREVLLLKRKELGDGPTNVDGIRLRYFETEIGMLREVFGILNEYPVVLTFNGDHFDFPYLKNRALKLGMKESEIPIEWNSNMEEARLKIGVHVDLFKFFNNRSMQVYAFSNKYNEGKTLDEISYALLGEGKVEHESPISDMDYVELAKYTYKDAELTYKLTSFDDDLVMKLMILLMRISKLSLDDLTRHNISAWIRNLMYYEHRQNNYLIPNSEDILRVKGYTATKAIIKGKKYLGAIVIDPPPGIFFNVLVVDFASLYPSVIKRWNLSYETVRCPHEECKDNLIPGTPHWVCKKRKGLTSKIVGFLRDLRVYVYKPLAKKEKNAILRHQYNVVQSALKVFINASYGVFGAETFPLYCPPVAECTTALGRYSIAETLKKAYELGISVLYGDTDSLFLWNVDKNKVNTLTEWVSRNLNIDLEIDKIYRWVAFSGRKKNYMGVFENGDVGVKGLVGKKRNTPEFIKNLFYNVIKILSSAENMKELEKAIENVKKVTQETYNLLKKGKYTLDELAFRVVMTKPLKAYVKTTPQHVKAARQLAKYGKQLGVGDIVSYVKIKGSEGVKAIQLARIDEIDQEKYVEHIRTTLEQIFEALGISFNEIVGIKLLESFIN